MRSYRTRILGTLPVRVTINEDGTVQSVHAGNRLLDVSALYTRYARGYMADFEESQSDNIRACLEKQKRKD